jgi:hypothetical protein
LIILRSIDFGAEDVELMTTVWAIEFLPRWPLLKSFR